MTDSRGILLKLSDARFAFLFAFLFAGPALPPSSARAEPASFDSVLELHRDTIIRSDVLYADGWIFAYSALGASTPTLSDHHKDKARLRALRQILLSTVTISDPPRGISAAFVEKMRTEYASKVTLSGRLEEVETRRVSHPAPGGIVVGIRESGITRRPVRFEEVVRSLLDRLSHDPRPELAALLVEVTAGTNLNNLPPKTQDDLIEIIGGATAAVCNSRCHAVVIDRYRPVSTLNQLQTEQFSGTSALSLLELWPFHPDATKFVADALTRAGHEVLAELIRSGTHTYSKKTLAGNTVFDVSAIIDIANVQVSPSLESSAAIQAILDYRGMAPACRNGRQGVDAFESGNREFFTESPGHVGRALSLYATSMSEVLSADSCNMLGRCLMLSGDLELASYCFRQALWLDGSHAYAGANLAVTLRDLGFTSAAAGIANHLLEDPALGEWARGVIESMIE